jgi:hypothetical protein
VPTVHFSSGNLTWNEVESAEHYEVLKNGNLFLKTKQTMVNVKEEGYADYQVIAVDKNSLRSFASEPNIVLGEGVEQVYEIEANAKKSALDYKGYSGAGFVEINKDTNVSILIPVDIREAGLYAIDLRYANGNGPVNTENKCAIRSAWVNGKFAGTFVFPQRGKGEWSNWGYSNSIKAKLSKGSNTISIKFESYNENMNGIVNQAMLDNLRIVRLQ